MARHCPMRHFPIFWHQWPNCWMGKGIEPAEQAQCLPNCKHEFSKGISASIVLKAKGLTAACKDLETAFVLTSVTPRYPCYRGKQFMILIKKQDIII